MPVVKERLEAINAPVAGIVDRAGTWGHVPWQVALSESTVDAAYGTEFTIPQDSGLKPKCWVLAEDIKAFYRLSSQAPSTEPELADARGVVRFAGAALTDPEAIDYIDINPRSIRRTRAALALAQRIDRPVVITSDNDYPGPQHSREYLAWDDSRKMTPQHIATREELRRAMWYVDDDTFDAAVRNTHEAAERVQGVVLPRAPMVSVEGNLDDRVADGKAHRLARGHIKKWTQEYSQRVEREMAMIKEKQYESYFLVVAEMITWAKERMLVGPGRGSSAGSLVCFLLGITEVDPLVHGLLFERFIDVNRADLPDIDIDFNDQKREQVFKHLNDLYGEENVARIGSVNRLKPRSVLAHVGKKMGVPINDTFAVKNVLIEYSSGDSRYGKGLEDTLKNTAPGREFTDKHPEAQVMGDLENHASHSGVHAAGIIVANVPVTEHCTVRNGIAQIDKKDAEVLNLLKIDALGLRTLGVIEDSGVVTPQDLYDLSLDDPEVVDIFNQGRYAGLFQFEGAAQRRVAGQMPIESFTDIDRVTALARPGPLGGGASGTYINRRLGREKVAYRHESMAEYLNDTKGVVLYQEQVMRIVRELGQFSWADTSTIRKAMSGRKGKEFFDRYGERFVAGASATGINEEDAHTIWDEICNFGAWGMNRSHTVSYAIISYWCAYMKQYHPLDYAAALLRNAKDDDQVVEMLRELKEEGVSFVPFDPDKSGQDWRAVDGQLIGGYTNLVGIGPVKAAYYVDKRDSGGGLTDKDRAKLARHQPKHNDLAPAHTLWGDMYRDPTSYNIHGSVKQFAELTDQENAVVICKLNRLERRDENETVRAARRGGQLKKGQTLFLDMFVVDDSVTKPVIARIRPELWRQVGEKVADRSLPGKEWYLIRGRWLAQFQLMIVKKIKCLSNPEVLS